MGMFEMIANVDDWGNMWYNRGNNGWSKNQN